MDRRALHTLSRGLFGAAGRTRSIFPGLWLVVVAALLAPLVQAQRPLPRKQVSIEVQDAEVANVLRLLAHEGHINLVLDEAVKGKVTLRLHNVSWHNALYAVLVSKGLGSEWNGSILRVAPEAVLMAEREARARARLLRDSSGPLKTWIIPVRYARAAELLPHVQSTLSPRGSASVDERTNVIIVQDVDPLAR